MVTPKKGLEEKREIDGITPKVWVKEEEGGWKHEGTIMETPPEIRRTPKRKREQENKEAQRHTKKQKIGEGKKAAPNSPERLCGAAPAAPRNRGEGESLLGSSVGGGFQQAPPANAG